MLQAGPIPFPEEANRMVRGHGPGPKPVRLPPRFLESRQGVVSRDAEPVVGGG